MRSHQAFMRAVLATAITSLTVLGATALTATAGSADATVEVTWGCDGSPFVDVLIESATADTYDIFVDGEQTDNDVPASDPFPYRLLPTGGFEDGFTHIVVNIHGGRTIYDRMVALSCNAPIADVDAACDGTTGVVNVFIADGNDFEFDVFVDDLGTPVAGGTGLTAGALNFLDFVVTPVSNGVHDVAIDGTDPNTLDEFHFEQSVTVSCAAATTTTTTTTVVDDSGALGQAFGNNPAPLAAVAGLLLVGGVTLVRTGRRRPA